MSRDEYDMTPTDAWSRVVLTPPSRAELFLWLLEDLCVIVARALGLMALLVVLLSLLGHR